MLREANKVTLYDDIASQLGALISSGKLKPGDRLPPERELAAQLGVSRPTLREVLKGMSLMGILDIKHGGGIFVRKDLSTSLLTEPLRFLSQEQKGSIVQLLEARQAVEVAAARLAAQRADESDIKKMRAELQAMNENLADVEEVSKHDLEFHLAICRASKNPMLFQFENIAQTLLYAAMKTTILIPNALRVAMEYHERILQAIENRDALLAETLLKEHLEALRAQVEASVSNDGNSESGVLV